MKTTTLGRTGLEVSIAGLGCGGHSRLGISYGKDFDHAVGVLRRAIELGVNFIDTATNYQTEPHVARAIAEVPRDSVVISSKCGVADEQGLLTGDAYVAKLEASLQRLETDYVDIYHLHGLQPTHCDHALQEIVPALQRAKEQGKLRHLAVSEAFETDRGHKTLKRVLDADVFDVMMVGFNPLNPSARRDVFPATLKQGVGTLGMFAVRQALTRPERLREVVAELIEAGKIDPQTVDHDDPLGFLGDVTDAGYRFSAHEPGLDVVLFGTGNPEHLETNLQSINADPLPAEQHAKLTELFGQLDTHSGN
ncbi:aldo/keto reductase [Algisphaera agarilytica]|uniref:Aryl-alcohol dehydrogenase-like predicted oxidoreductase n=1 Tax=Algisphaera agarilytica TaxID=1385975 RepID=A0A7X0H567_9BACT|nr:aldo/keto reductase [Algisphaera agarilytica]MBB6429439.1 aryl-alcohol dehydrogenase-like predicted oxidoreductase [Algisphaera agarilytica]